MEKQLNCSFAPFVAFFVLAVVLFSGCTGTDQNSGADVVPYNANGSPGKNQIKDTPPLDYNLYNSGVLFAYVGEPYAFSFCDPQYDESNAQPVASPAGVCNPDHAGQLPSGGNPPYHFQLDSGKGLLPMGLTLHPNGFVDGVPTTPGSSYFTICAIDQSGQQACSETWIEVKGVGVTFDSLTCQKATDFYGTGLFKFVVVAKGTVTGGDNVWYWDNVWENMNNDNALGYGDIIYGESDCGNWKLGSTCSCTSSGAEKPTSWTLAYYYFLHYRPITITSKVYADYTTKTGGMKKTTPIVKQVQCG